MFALTLIRQKLETVTMIYYPKEYSKWKIDFSKTALSQGPNFMIFYVLSMILLMAASLGVTMALGAS
ncbi:hypothetical protein [Mucilaginibacter ginkgonis]|uniref:Uncharacterized protein n=1 Tax=Mucilaginibacter ginkgonis TaxID=2682091 RepID=A0A6I4I2V1_9SPHI|nr:hypothetical protein [Mucilaginibacter ginkgonis]QQL48299.1 hypothetical protein GO620_008830 [Mucilaginibacter ginkgonis]